MTKAELLAELRQLTGDKKQPYLWSDARLIRWLAEGEDRFCELTGFFLDTVTYTIVTVAGEKNYAIPSFSRIIKINNVWDGDRRLVSFNQRQRPTTETFSQVTTTNTRPQHYQTDKTTGYLTLFEAPIADITLTLEVWRKPKVSLITATSPEIPEEFQLAAAEWAAYKAYNDHDAEKLDLKKASDHLGGFNDYVSMGRRAFSRLHLQSPQVAPNPLYVV